MSTNVRSWWSRRRVFLVPIATLVVGAGALLGLIAVELPDKVSLGRTYVVSEWTVGTVGRAGESGAGGRVLVAGDLCTMGRGARLAAVTRDPSLGVLTRVDGPAPRAFAGEDCPVGTLLYLPETRAVRDLTPETDWVAAQTHEADRRAAIAATTARLAP